MWFGRRRALMENLETFLQSATAATDGIFQWIRAFGAPTEQSIESNGGKIIIDSDLRLLLAEQAAALLRAKENLMILRGRRHFFSVRDVYMPIDPDDFEEGVAKIWARMWPDQPYPRYEQLTAEQRYICFGPDAKKFRTR